MPVYFRVDITDNRFHLRHGLEVSDTDSFTIVQFADLHFGEQDEKDEKSKRVMQNILDAEQQAGLVVFSGDQLSSYKIENSGHVLRQWTRPLTALPSHIPFATVFGNHDDEAYSADTLLWYFYVKWIMVAILIIQAAACYYSKARRYIIVPSTVLISLLWLMMAAYPSTIMRTSLLHYETAYVKQHWQGQDGDPSLHGLSNYFLPIKCMNQTALIFFLDSGGGRIEVRYTDLQLEWVKSVTAGYQGANAIAFAHIPSIEYEQALKNQNSFRCFGNQFTEPGDFASWDHTPPMKSLAAAGVRAVFVGHNHRNSYCCVPRQENLGQPALCYGRQTGYGGYGTWEGTTWNKGARIIKLTFKNHTQAEFSIQTWLRMENGSKLEFDTLYPFNVTELSVHR
jgi:hypothetical protein